MNSKKLYWSEFHSNIHSPQLNDLEQWYDFAKEMLDFWGIAYYPFYIRLSENGMPLEDIRASEIINKDWEEIREFVREKEKTDDFVVYMGYEWQGNGEDGDHNVFFLSNEEQMVHPMTYKELCEKLPLGKAIAIPHHTGYALGHRGKNWGTHDHRYSPVTEIYSSHGSSESDVNDIPLNVHIHMGPRSSDGTVINGLNKGKITGIICSGDNHINPAISGNGFFGVWADNYDKESIFKAILNRNVYGVTRNRIKLYYTLNGHLMGSIIDKSSNDEYKAVVDVEAGNAIDRIEIIRNGIVEHTYVHNGKWERDKLSGIVRFKFELELGWGPDIRVYPDITEKQWKGKVTTEGKILSVEKLWTSPGQEIINQEENTVEFNVTTRKGSVGSGKLSQKNHATPYIQTQSMIFEIEADINSIITIKLDDKEYKYSVSEILDKTHLIGLVDEAKELAKERFGVSDFYRSDPFWHNAYKIKIHKGVPYKGYKVAFDYVINGKEMDYVMVKVHQKNGEKAWASPIWIK